MRVAAFKYKCRRCGQVFDGEEVSALNAMRVLYNNARPTETHLCYKTDGRDAAGVGDLLGYDVKEKT